MSRKYIFDKNDFEFKRAKTPARIIVRRAVLFFLASVSLAVVYYVIFALFFSTEEEKRLARENRMYEQIFSEIDSKERLLSDVIEGLQVRDNRIYEEIFHTSAPNNPSASVDYLTGLDSIPDQDIVLRSEEHLRLLGNKADQVELFFQKAIRTVQDTDFVMPPMMTPLKDFSFAQTGASVGEKISPFYKVKMMHNGLDLIAPTGQPVLAVADGVVSEVTKSRKGFGNVVSIDHGNGYKTRYAHLADIEVRKGRKVKKGTTIGYVGLSGNSFAPHLHYEVIRDTVVLDPVHYFFASVDPEEYVNILIMSASTGQAME